MERKQINAGRLLAICSARVFLFATFMTVAAVIPLITVEWALSATSAGAIVSAFTFCYAASVFGFAWAADHFGAKRMVWFRRSPRRRRAWFSASSPATGGRRWSSTASSASRKAGSIRRSSWC
jgi:MFS family permease